MSNQSVAASFMTTGRNASLFSSDMLRKLVYLLKEENQTSASSDGSPRNTAGANDVSMIGGIAGGGCGCRGDGCCRRRRRRKCCVGNLNTLAAGGTEDGADDGGDVNVDATNSSVADPRVDNAGGLANGSLLGRDIHVLFSPDLHAECHRCASQYARN